MEIDDTTEPLVRAAFDASINKDVDRLNTALKAFPDETARRKGLALALAISGAVLYDSHQGRPSPDQTRHVAAALADMLGWAAVTEEEAHTYLTVVLDGGSLADALDPRTVVLLTFVIAAELLAASPKIDKDETWADYLDRIEAQLKATPS
ncbi:MAG: hypothetical protein ACRDUA_07155 [Micromonosporaceae bacterium]